MESRRRSETNVEGERPFASEATLYLLSLQPFSFAAAAAAAVSVLFESVKVMLLLLLLSPSCGCAQEREKKESEKERERETEKECACVCVCVRVLNLLSVFWLGGNVENKRSNQTFTMTFHERGFSAICNRDLWLKRERERGREREGC